MKKSFVMIVIFLMIEFFHNGYMFNYYKQDPYLKSVQVSGGYKNNMINITAREIKYCMIYGQGIAFSEQTLGDELPNYGIYLNRNSSGYLRFSMNSPPKTLANLRKSSNIMIRGLQVLCDKYVNELEPSYSRRSISFIKSIYDKKFKMSGVCQDVSNIESCRNYGKDKYRSYSGLCNNMNNPTWGMAETPYTRLAFPSYSDGIYSPAISVYECDLPSPREISQYIFSPRLVYDGKLSQLASEFAQLIGHDSNLAVTDSVAHGPIMCCTNSGKFLPFHLTHHSCMPIEVPANDPFYSNYGVKCMTFVRSLTAPNSECSLGPGEQVNGVSSYLDLSFVYGNSKDTAKYLRALVDGELLKRQSGKKSMLPLTNSTMCDDRSADEICYMAGDTRVNQNPLLSVLQTILFREHNRIARELQEVNPKWNDEKLFQESRRILIAIFQHIVYKEYLPIILGTRFTEMLFCESDSEGFTYNYDPKQNAASFNSMNIIFRVFHSTIPHSIQIYSDTCERITYYNFSDYMLRPVLANKHLDGILNGLNCAPMVKIGSWITPEVQNKLFKSYKPYGLDLMAMDIQRGRDHGIPGYNRFRELLGFKRARTFQDLISEMGQENVERLQYIYKHVDDIDLIVGATVEKPLVGAQFGPVTLTVLKEQFFRYMIGDRYFYTYKNQPYPFTAAQLKEIHKMTMAKLICENGDNIKYIQKNAFLLESDLNPRMRCTDIPGINFYNFK